MERRLRLDSTDLSAPNELEGSPRRIGRHAGGMLEFEKSLDLKIERVYHYASLQLAEDSANPEYLARMGQLQNLLTKISETASFIDAGNPGDRRRKIRAISE